MGVAATLPELSEWTLHNHKNCLLKILQFVLCLVSEIFSSLPVFLFDFACIGRRSAGHLVHQGYNRGMF